MVPALGESSMSRQLSFHVACPHTREGWRVVRNIALSEDCGQSMFGDAVDRAPYFEPYVETVRKLPFVDGARLEAPRPNQADIDVDGRLRLDTPVGPRTLLVEHKRNTPNRAQAEQIIAAMRPPDDWICFVPYVTPALGDLLADAGINYVDLAGNLRLALGRHFFVHVQGRKAAPQPRVRGPGVAGAQVLLALLVRPELASATVRELAQGAGVGKTAAADALHDLERYGLLVRHGDRINFAARGVLDGFLALYGDRLRPKLLVARLAASEQDPAALERRLEGVLQVQGLRWAWGGIAAAYRLAPHHRGHRTVLYVEGAEKSLAPALRLLPKRDGDVLLMRAPGPLVFEAGALPHVVPPLLAYAEMLSDADERTREAAEVLRTKCLGDLR